VSSPSQPATANPVEYIHHHLTNWCLGCNPETHQPADVIDFSVIFVDTLLFGWLVGGLFMWIAWKVGRNLSLDKPSSLQNFFEALVEFVNQQVKDLFPGINPLIGPLGLTIFTWVFLMNLMDLVPVDLLPWIAQLIGHYGFGLDPHHVYLKVVPTANLDTTFALALSVFVLIIYYNIRVKGALGYFRMFLFHPFGKFLIPFNIVMTAVEEIAKPVSLAMRLFGNLFAAELLFVLIALLSFAWYVLPAQVFLGSVWALYHLIVIPLQAFIFMLLTIVYLSLTHQSEH
jgi:F-type H+-transporting ATPase subunit a